MASTPADATETAPVLDESNMTSRQDSNDATSALQPGPSSSTAQLGESQAPPASDAGDNSNAPAVLTALDEESLADEGYGESDGGSFMTSILSSVRRGVEENGRIYPSYGKHEYGMPVDEKELDRMDLQHHKFTLLLNDQLFLAPFPENYLDSPERRVLDIGTGSGIWAIDMADKYAAEIIGSDIAATQPAFVPPNCIFEIDDAEADWSWPPEHFDFVHCRDMMTAIRDWPRLIAQAYAALRPGGWIQLSSTVPEIFSDDGTMPQPSAFKECCDLFFEIGRKMNTDLLAPRQWKGWMEEAGFQHVFDTDLKMPSGPWTKSRRLREVGLCERQMLLDSLESFLIRGYTQLLGGTTEQLAVLCALARKEIRDPKVHTYAYFQVTCGQKSELAYSRHRDVFEGLFNASKPTVQYKIYQAYREAYGVAATAALEEDEGNISAMAVRHRELWRDGGRMIVKQRRWHQNLPTAVLPGYNWHV